MAGLGASELGTGPGPVPATRVELTVSCRQLLDRDTFSKSDPICVLYTQRPGSHQWREFGRTEVIDNSLNPDFLHKFVLDYCFEERQNLRFDLYDVDSKNPDLSKHDFLGQAFCTLGEIVGSAGSRLEKPLTMGTATMHPRGRRSAPAASNGGILGKKCGTIILLAEELGNCRDVATLQFCANKLDKKDFFGKSDPFMVFYRSNEDGTFTICHKTEVVRNTLNPVWAAFAIPVRALCNGDHDRAIKVEVYDWDRDGSHDFIGEFTTSYRELARGQSHFNVYEVVNPRKKMKKKKYLNSGTVTLLSFTVEAEHTFLDYIRGGTQLNFTVAIDFTASNGNPSQPTSLHYLSPFQLNAYSLALRAVGDIIQDYDSDKMFPALGFGAKVPPDGQVSHKFPLNGDASNPACHGIAGVLEAYQRSLRHVQLYGPTNFAPVVNHVARSAATVLDGSQYFVLLIITDGVISDMAQTKEAIVNAAKLPMSIIIVGVGQAEFDAMVELDGDDIRISSRGKVAERDIVQHFCGISSCLDSATLKEPILSVSKSQEAQRSSSLHSPHTNGAEPGERLFLSWALSELIKTTTRWRRRLAKGGHGSKPERKAKLGTSLLSNLLCCTKGFP
ncbi:copine-5-like isoform X1 [Vidua macroura]|uniref:copine-5-like isoform X1 n=1 Tax=Vidua macroura TaxID=187451 RepID=UPI0023A8389E|nr:copine-5-like isoform X1 [Vidua macroura]